MANDNLPSPQPREERIIWRDIDTLLLDPENPRISIEPADNTQARRHQEYGCSVR